MDAAAPAAQMTIATRSRRDRVSATGPSVSPVSTSCFHSRSECSRANSRDKSSRLPIRLTATRNASSARRPTATSSSTELRRWSSSSSASDFCSSRRRCTYWRHCTNWFSSSSRPSGAVMPGPPTGRCQRPEIARAEPDLFQRVHDRVPLAALLGKLSQALVGDAVVLAPPLPSDRLPARLHIAEALKPVQQRVKQSLGPVQLSTGQLVDPSEDGVAVALPLGQDAQHHRCR